MIFSKKRKRNENEIKEMKNIEKMKNKHALKNNK